MSQTKNQSNQNTSQGVVSQKSLFKDFDDSSQAKILGELIDVRTRLHHINLYTVFKIDMDPVKVEIDIRTLIADCALVFDRIRKSLDMESF